MISTIVNSSAVKVPFPVAVNGVPLTGGEVGMHKICAKSCSGKLCLSSPPLETERICSNGLRYHVYTLGDALVCVFGLTPYGASVGGRPDLKGRGFPQVVVSSWIGGLAQLLALVASREAKARAEALDSLHDISRMAVDVSSISGKILDRAGGLEAAGALELSLIKASELLIGEFDRIELLINPASAAAGSRYTHVYKLCHKLVQIIDIALCKPNNKRIRMNGRSDMTLKLYESVSTLIFSLVENAAKHAFPNFDPITVEVSDSAGCVEISVVSVGPVIQADEVDLIFGKGVRGRWAQGRVNGRGIGLFLAKIVADAHSTKVQVSSVVLGYERDSVPVARNEFKVKLREV